MTTRRGSQYSIQSDGGVLRIRNGPKKGNRKRKIFSGTDSIQGGAISQRQVPEMPIISEPEFKQSMSNSKRDKYNSEGSNRHIYHPVQAVSNVVQGQRLGNVSTNPPRSDELLENAQNVSQRGINCEIL
ncbi:hypothetical protein O181_133091 [Austropuccinia psidii MF-1]|uniref:Uncharacterized protein n=1 Tax=Austropuccinia psidii MF-1 TaxID=1389203 RepID=A0A9Q3QBR8_9BASI|nr:hypothetical protein [Austropuccinia psidii MF-1]